MGSQVLSGTHKRLYLAEKPDVGEKIARVLAKQHNAKLIKKPHAFILTPSVRVTWLKGHLLGLYMPGDYDKRWQRMTLESLPIVPKKWKFRPKNHHARHIEALNLELKWADEVVIATDFDREGESIARTFLDYFGFRGRLSRIKLLALDEKNVIKALNNPFSAKKTWPLYDAALARLKADWLFGINLSRFFTLAAQRGGLGDDNSGVFSVGRVQTPTIWMVVERDREISCFTPERYYTLDAFFSVYDDDGNAVTFKGRWIPDEWAQDDKKRCIDKMACKAAQDQVRKGEFSISEAKIELHEQSASLPFDLTSLQRFANIKWKYTAKQTLEAAQSLYAKHGAIYYPRTECRHIPTDLFPLAAGIIAQIGKNIPYLKELASGCDPNTPGRAYSDIHLQDCSHHGIIPTEQPVDISRLSQIERRIYEAICRQYLMQHYPVHLYRSYDYTLDVNGELFRARFRKVVEEGWKVLEWKSSSKESLAGQGEDAEDEGVAYSVAADLLAEGKTGHVSSVFMDERYTKPPNRYTEESLLRAMETVHTRVEDPEMRRVLKQAKGLGTPATRAEIIAQAIEKGYLKRDGNILMATSKAFSLMAMLPKSLRSPLITARWELALEEIARGQGRSVDFMREIEAFVSQLINQGKALLTRNADDGSTTQ